MTVQLSPAELAAITTRTLEHYDRSADSFWRGTQNHDVSQNIEALLRHIEGEPPHTILDFGCGPGRDLQVFTARGHVAIGLEASPRFAAMARDHSGCEVWEQNFLDLKLPPERFDGVFANASLFHVPTQELPRILRALHATLKPRGVLFSSNPRGHGEEGLNQGRYGAFWDIGTWRHHVVAAGFVELEHYYRPAGLPVQQCPWLATVWRAMPLTA
jgi:SAM-dependent methyltransferase